MKRAWLLAMLLAGCGGGESAGPVEPVVEEPAVANDGSVELANGTAYDIEVAYLNEVDPAAPHIVRTQVPAGQRAEVSGTVLPGGWTVEFDLVLIPQGEGVRVRRKVEVAIDGDLVLNVRLADASDPFSVEIEPQT